MGQQKVTKVVEFKGSVGQQKVTKVVESVKVEELTVIKLIESVLALGFQATKEL